MIRLAPGLGGIFVVVFCNDMTRHTPVPLRGEYAKHLDKVCEALVPRCELLNPLWGIVLGSGLQDAATELSERVSVPLPTFGASVTGHGSEILSGRLGRMPVLVATGRHHFYEAIPAEGVVFNVALFSKLGIKKVLLCNAAGSLNSHFMPGSLMLIQDHIDATFHAFTDAIVTPDDRPFDSFYDAELLGRAAVACRNLFGNPQIGVYTYVSGPFYETKAEIRALQTMGADAVGMSTVPEAIYAAAAGMRVLAISVITNMATGLAAEEHRHLDVVKSARNAASDLGRLIQAILNDESELADSQGLLHCRERDTVI